MKAFSMAVGLVLVGVSSFAQNKTLGVGVSTPNPNAALHVESPGNNQGILIPRLSSSQRSGLTAALAAADVGLIVFDTDARALAIWNGTTWDIGSKVGAPISIDNNTPSGAAATLLNSNAANAAPALAVNTSGTGNAIETTGKIKAGQFVGDGSAVTNVNAASVAPNTIASVSIIDNEITNADINAAAAISGAKINPDFAAQNIATTGTVTAASFIGDGSLLTAIVTPANSVSSGAILDNTIENKDISPTATIAGSKIDPNFGAQNIITTGTVTGTAFTGDGSALNNVVATGAVANSIGSSNIIDNEITNADINASAAISGAKINPDFGAQNISTTGTITGATGSFSGNVAVGNLSTIQGVNYNWPLSQATGTKVLQNDGSGNLAWASSGGGGDLLGANNLSDLSNTATARTNLGLGSLATQSSVGSTEITDGSVTDIDINAAAAIADTKLAVITSSGKVANSATTATNTNTASAIVARDASGNFNAGSITATAFSGDGSALTGVVATPGTNTVGSAQIIDGTVSSADILDATIVNADILNVDASKITTGSLPVANGGTGATTAPLARTNLGLGALATLATVSTAEITDGTIANVDINATAAIADTKLATISSAGKIANSATTATNANTASAIVARDASGNFSAGTITAAAFSGDGSALTGLPGLTLPYSGSNGSASTTFDVTATGTAGAGYFKINNASSAFNALIGETNGGAAAIRANVTGTGTANAGRFEVTNASNNNNAVLINHAGTGSAISANREVTVSNNSTNGGAGSFTVANAANSVIALSSSTNGTGRAFSALTTGTSQAAQIQVSNASNSQTVLDAITNGTGRGINVTLSNASNANAAINIAHSGTGNAITANKPIQATDIIATGNLNANGLTYTWPGVQAGGVLTNNGSGGLSWATSAGLTLPYSQSDGSGSTSFAVAHTASSGSVANFSLANGSSLSSAVSINNSGTGAGLNIQQTGDATALSLTTNTGSASPALLVTNNGNGSGLSISQNATPGSFPALGVFNSSTQSGINVNQNGTSGSALNLSVIGAGNSSPAINISHSGTGNAITANKPIQATDIIATGNLNANGLNYTWPGAQATGVLRNNGVGSLSWSADGLTVPYASGVVSSGSALMDLNNSGSGSTLIATQSGTGMVGWFNNTNPSNPNSTLLVQSSGGATAFQSTNNGTSGAAGSFMNGNASNGSFVLAASTSGTGVAATFTSTNATSTNSVISGTHNGLGAGLNINLNNAANTTAAIQINHAGTALAINANKPIQATQFIASGSLSANLVDIIQSGTTNGGGVFQILNGANAASALTTTTNGTGSGISVNVSNASNSAPAINISHTGTGNAITANRPIQATSFIGDGSALTNLPSSGWGLTGNTGTVDGTSFIGTTDNIPFNIRVNNQKAARIDPLSSNAFFGYQAGNVNTGSDNTFIGTASGAANSSGYQNTAVGRSTLSATTTGYANTAVGHSSLSVNTTGYRNVAIGYVALNNNNANENTAIGFASMFSNTTGALNAAGGGYSLYTNTIGTGNTAFGYGSLRYNLDGSSNTAFGQGALQNNTSGTQNQGVGVAALLGNTTGNYNVGMGYYALSANTVGANNTAVGNSADVSANNLTNATAIGANTVVNSSNKIRLGNAAVTVIEGQVGFTAASDKRLKTNIQDLSEGLDFILKLKPVSYFMKNQEQPKLNWGFIAQDIEQLVGTENSILTIGGDKERTLGLRYTDFIAPLVKSVQEQQSKIQSLEARLAELESKLLAEAKK